MMSDRRFRKQEAEYKKAPGMPAKGHVFFDDDGYSAYIWDRPAWVAAIKLERRDQSAEDFQALVAQVVALVKAGSK